MAIPYDFYVDWLFLQVSGGLLLTGRYVPTFWCEASFVGIASNLVMCVDSLSRFLRFSPNLRRLLILQIYCRFCRFPVGRS